LTRCDVALAPKSRLRNFAFFAPLASRRRNGTRLQQVACSRFIHDIDGTSRASSARKADILASAVSFLWQPALILTFRNALVLTFGNGCSRLVTLTSYNWWRNAAGRAAEPSCLLMSSVTMLRRAQRTLSVALLAMSVVATLTWLGFLAWLLFRLFFGFSF
jgi:hypothetical protein